MDFGYCIHINKIRFVVTLTALLFFITDGVCPFEKIFQLIFSKDIYLAQKATSALRLVIK